MRRLKPDWLPRPLGHWSQRKKWTTPSVVEWHTQKKKPKVKPEKKPFNKKGHGLVVRKKSSNGKDYTYTWTMKEWEKYLRFRRKKRKKMSDPFWQRRQQMLEELRRKAGLP